MKGIQQMSSYIAVIIKCIIIYRNLLYLLSIFAFHLFFKIQEKFTYTNARDLRTMANCVKGEELFSKNLHKVKSQVFWYFSCVIM